MLAVQQARVQIRVRRILAQAVGADILQVLLRGVVGVEVLDVFGLGPPKLGRRLEELFLRLVDAVGAVADLDGSARAVCV